MATSAQDLTYLKAGCVSNKEKQLVTNLLKNHTVGKFWFSKFLSKAESGHSEVSSYYKLWKYFIIIGVQNIAIRLCIYSFRLSSLNISLNI